MRRPLAASLAAFLLLAASRGLAGEAPRLDVHRHRLRNGLTVLVLEHRLAPVVSCSVFYRVGSANERPGRTGITHLLEHMMFKGTRRIGTRDFAGEAPLIERINELHERIGEIERSARPGAGHAAGMLREELAEAERRADSLMVKNELWKILMRRGAVDLNAFTGKDRTQYLCSLPANQLELWMWLEADRMGDAVFREFHRERAVVLEERRLSIDDSPAGTFGERLYAAAFIAHPYRWPIIGWASDIERITLPMVEEHYRRSYAPNNAVVVIVGRVVPAEVVRLAERYFGRIPSQPPLPPVVTREPPQRGKREVRLALEASPRVALAFHRPPSAADDAAALDVLETVLSAGRTSRLHRGLVEGRRVAVSAAVTSPTAKYPSLFIAHAVPRRPHTVGDVERAIREEIDLLAREPVGDWELQKAKNVIEADFVRSLESVVELCGLVGTFEVIDRWEYLNEYVPRIRAVTAGDVARAARDYLQEETCTTVVIP
ncbi:MAG: pitrilysin family protein [bacterium]|nr:pitrilysin family protein [bacterium]